MKRLLSLALSAALLAALTLPAAAAEETQDARLAKVTALVKEALALDTEAYETFHGGLTEDLVPLWNLSWEGENRSLSVSALEDGTVVSLYRWESETAPAGYRWSFPTFPGSGSEGAQAVARDFLDRVLRPGETVELGASSSEGGLSDSNCRWSGTVDLNGLPSPLHYSLSVENGQVEQFSRDVPEAAVVGGVPSPEAGVDRARAAGDLEETLKLRLEYVEEKAGRAVLRYVPDREAHSFLVDAKTGELLDLTELEAQMSRDSIAGGGEMENAAPTAKAMDAGEAGLTRAEQEGVRQMEGVLAPEALDKALRAESAYGLLGYALLGTVYESLTGEAGNRVTCALRYGRTEDGERLTRTITVDAKTGAVDSVRSSAPWDREQRITEEEALEKAEAFLETLCPERDLTLYQKDSGVSPLRTGKRAEWSFTFARAVNGLPFPANAYRVGIDAADGSVYSLSSTWDEEMAFDDANGLVSLETALSAWAGTYEAELAYRNVPRKLSKGDPAKLLEQGMEYAYGLRLTYGLEREGWYAGVDAKTGKPVQEDLGRTREPLTYKDLAGSSAKADVEALARYGVGYEGGSFRPAKRLTQWELVCLVSSLQGSARNPDAAEKDQRDSAYYDAYRLGLLRPAERDDGALLTRADVVRMLLDAAGYGPAARLRGIYTCDYSDKGTIPAEGLGYASIAQALGLASGAYAGDRAATRGDAASMLCRVLERET